MNINDKIHGWLITDACRVKEIDATLYLLSHESGAKLCYIEREDQSKTFAVTFGTVPTDDTGVFHILEHAVLCGSEKFPTKEPFTELLKGSLNTFLNAMTYNDRTSYPVASRNDKDFYNLVSIYLDAVFRPRATSVENIFRQEGWRYELGEDGLEYNGVVYSEMQGAYSSPDELADYHLSRLIYPGGTYSYDAGGHPDCIPGLTYEQFCAMHSKFYRPENAYFFLDGKPDLDSILPLINSYLDGHERESFSLDIELGGEIITEPFTAEYGIEPGEDASNKGRVYLAYRAADYSEIVRSTALTVIIDALADSNDAPLKKAILASDLCDNVYLYAPTGNKYNSFNVEFRGVKDGCESELIAHFDRVIADTVKGGVDKALISASIDLAEFRAREADYGSYPKGIVYLSAIMEGWLYGIHPKYMLSYESIYTELRKNNENDYYTLLLKEIISGERATLILHPSATYAEKSAKKTGDRLNTVAKEIGEAGIAALAAQSKDFLEWQSIPDTPEALSTIPRLSISDLGDMPCRTPTEVQSVDGATVLYHPIPTSGISYLEIYLDASDTAPEDIPALVFMGLLYSNLDTVRGSAGDFRRRSKSELGSIALTNHAAKLCEEPKLYMLLQLSFLDTKKTAALPLFEEYLYGTVLENRAAVRRILTQLSSTMTDRIISAGHSYAVTRCAARYSRFEALKERVIGYEFYRWIKKMASATDKELDLLIEKMAALRAKIFTRPRTTAALTGVRDPELIRSVVEIIKKDGAPSGKSEIQLLPTRNEGIAIPSQVSYAALGTNLYTGGEDYHTGAWSTLATLLNYQILWEEVRVKGGAYGTGFVSRANSGTTAFYSYRDPNPARAISIFRTAPERIREALSGDTDLTNFIIGTVGTLDEVTTPATDGNTATTLYLAGKSHEDVIRARREVIATDTAELIKLSETLEQISERATVTVVGSREVLETLGLDNILEI